MTTAYKITLARIAMIPVFIWFAYVGGKTGDLIALGIFLLASLTDFLDGYIARKYHQVTDFGKFVDPLADKLLVCAALLLFIQRGQMESAMVFIILAREFIITSLRIVAVAQENGVFITENKPLARGLYEAVDLDREIPDRFYQPVAEVLAFVYSLKKKELK